MSTPHTDRYFDEVAALAAAIDRDKVDSLARGLAAVRERDGRLFVLGVGGGAGNASHAVNDFRKLCAIESYAPTDNVSELTARTNDDGWDTSFSAWLETSRLNERDALLIFSVGGGSREHRISVNLVNALELARDVGAAVYGIVGSPGGSVGAARARRYRRRSPAGPPHAARRVVSGSRVACARLASRARRPARALGIDHLAVRPRGLPRPRRRPQRARARPVARTARVPARPRATSQSSHGAVGGSRRALRRRGLSSSWASNQPAAAKGVVSIDRLEARPRASHRAARARRSESFDAFQLCFHHPAGTVPELAGAVRLPQAGARHAASTRRASSASTWQRAGWSATRTPTSRRERRRVVARS